MEETQEGKWYGMRTRMKAERLKQMEEYISKREFVTVEELSEKFSIHKNTVRSDINELAAKGIVEKKYGGISCKSYLVPTSYEEREVMSVESKRRIGALAASFLEEEDVIYVDSGTTASMLFCEPALLPEHLTIITNSLPVINRCFQKTNYNIYALPGKVNRWLNSFASYETIESLSSFNIQKAFLGTRGISDKGELSSASQIDGRIKATIIENARECYLMAESEKVAHPAMINFAHLSAFQIWISDEATKKAEELSEMMQVRLVTPSDKNDK